MVKNLPAMQETWVRSLSQEDPLEKGLAIHSSILSWRIPWTEEPGRLQSMGSQRVGHDWETNTTLLFQILKNDAVKVLHSICQQIWKPQQWPQVWKRSVFIPIPKKGNAKECSNYHTIMLISHTSKVMLKILQSRLWQHLNREFPNVQAGYKKSRGTRDQIASTCWIIEKVKEFQKTIYLLIDKAKAFDSVVHNKLWKILKEMGLSDHLTCLLRNLYAGQEATARIGHGTTWTGSKLGK